MLDNLNKMWTMLKEIILILKNRLQKYNRLVKMARQIWSYFAQYADISSQNLEASSI